MTCPRLNARFVLLALLGVAGSGCGSQYGPDRSGMADPGRTDTQPIKVIVGAERYIIPANCFSSPVDASKTIAGYAVQDAILLTILFPSGECRSESNRAAFRELGHGRRITFSIAPYRGLTRLQALQMHLVRMIEPEHSTHRRTDLPKADFVDRKADEDVWRTLRSAYHPNLPPYVRSDTKRMYVVHCRGTTISAGIMKSCSLITYGKNAVRADFSPAFFDRRREILTLIAGKLNEMGATGATEKRDEPRIAGDLSA